MMSKALRTAIEDPVRPTLASMLQWHPLYADTSGSPPPLCYYEFMQWARCVQHDRDCKEAFDRLYACIRRISKTDMNE